MELLKKYREEIEKDLVINDFNIKEVQMRLASRKHFWVGRLIDAKIAKSDLEKRKKALKRALVTKIIAEAPVKLTTSTAESAAEQCDDIADINDKLKEYEYVIEYLEKVEKIMGGMGWEIKNLIALNLSERE